MNRIARLIVAGMLVMRALPASASSARVAGPLDEVNDASVSVSIGDSLMQDDERVIPLFDKHRARADSFEAALTAAIVSRVDKAGIKVSSKSTHAISFAFFGGAQAAGDHGSLNFFLLEVSVTGSESDPCGCGDRSRLGIADDAGLEAALTKAAIAAVDEFLASRERSREGAGAARE